MTAATSIHVRAAATSVAEAACALAEFGAQGDPVAIHHRLRGIEAAVSTVRANLAAAGGNSESARLAAALGGVVRCCRAAAALAETHTLTAVPAEILAVIDVIGRCARLVVLGLHDLDTERLALLHLAAEAEQTLTRWSLARPGPADDHAAELGRELLGAVHAFLALAYPVR